MEMKLVQMKKFQMNFSTNEKAESSGLLVSILSTVYTQNRCYIHQTKKFTIIYSQANTSSRYKLEHIFTIYRIIIR